MINHKKGLFAAVAVLGGVFLLTGCALPGQQKEQVQQQITTRGSGMQQQNNVQQGAANRMNGGMGQGEHMTNIDSIAKGELSEAEKEGILQMREEEKLARDVYAALGAKWGQNVFLNITSSEQTHMDEVKLLIDRYGLTDPATDGTAGKFVSAEMQKLYNDLIAQGNTSLVDAFKVGATIEDMDIKDLQDLTTATDNADIKYVYENLMNGSKRHLQSFVKNLSKNSATYTPQYISQTDLDTIIGMDRENGGKSNGGCMKDDASCDMQGSGGCMDGTTCGMHDGSGAGQGNGAGSGMRQAQ